MRPTREQVRTNEFAYFVSTQTEERKPFFRHERWARLMVATLHHYVGTGYTLHAFVVMPDHLHLLITPLESVEKAVQLIKGGFSFRAKSELQWSGGIWQPGFTDHRIRDVEDWQEHLAYIRNNPVNAHLVNDVAQYEFMGMLRIAFPQGLKPAGFAAEVDVRAEARTLQSKAGIGSEPAKDRPRGLKPTGFAAEVDVRAEARTLQSEAGIGSEPAKDRPQGLKPAGFAAEVDVRAKAPTLQSVPAFGDDQDADPWVTTNNKEFKELVHKHATQK